MAETFRMDDPFSLLNDEQKSHQGEGLALTAGCGRVIFKGKLPSRKSSHIPSKRKQKIIDRKVPESFHLVADRLGVQV